MLATLDAGRRADARAVEAHAARLERAVVGGARREWMACLHEAVALILSRADSDDPDVVRARERATVVIANHHNLLLGLRDRLAPTAAQDRARLADLEQTPTPTGVP